MLKTTKAGFVAVIGAPNAGKSTLVNRLIGSKISIVTHKVQTTRSIIRGIVIRGNTQIVFVDTPGIFEPRRRLDRAMVDAAWRGIGDADLVVLVHDVQKNIIDDDTYKILKVLRTIDRKIVLALNKVDLISTKALLPLVANFNEIFDFDSSFMISAENGKGCEDLLLYLEAQMPSGPWFYPEDEISDLPERLLAAELTREQVFLRLHEELPYGTTVETEEWSEREDGAVVVNQIIYVKKSGHKKITLGRGGSMIRAIGSAARNELQNILGRPVHLFLFVKVRKNWMEDPDRYKLWGLNPDA